MDKTVYDTFMATLYTALWVFTPQGRVGGIRDLRFRQRTEMLEKGFTYSSQFKTSATYGYQPVTLCSISAELFFIYITKVTINFCFPILPALIHMNCLLA